MEYGPKLKRANHIPFGYYHAPGEDRVLLPDPKALDSLHYSFEMKAKYRTPLRDCTMWLQRTTGYKITPQGFKHLYDKWRKKLRHEKLKETQAKTKEILKEKEKVMKEKYGQFGVTIDEDRGITALAYQQAFEKWKTKKAKR